MDVEGKVTEITDIFQRIVLSVTPLLIVVILTVLALRLIIYLQKGAIEKTYKEEKQELNEVVLEDEDDENWDDDTIFTDESTVFQNENEKEKIEELNSYDALKCEEAQERTVEEKVIHNILSSEASTNEMKERAESLLPHFATPSKEEIELKNKQDDIELDLRTLERIVDGRIELDKIKTPSK